MLEKPKKNAGQIEHQRLRDFLFGDAGPGREQCPGDYGEIDPCQVMKLANILVPSSLVAAFLLSLFIFHF